MRIQYDEANIRQLLENFSKVSSICISVFDTRFQNLTGADTRKCPFCQYMRQDMVFCEGCELSNRTAMRHVLETHDIYIYECHAGLTEVIVPIMADRTLLCYLMIGQFILENTQQCWEHSCQLCSDPRIYTAKQPYDQILRITQEQLYAWIDILKSYIGYQTLMPYISIQTDHIFESIRAYIIEHVGEKLTAHRICAEFDISKNRLYDIVRRNTEQTLNEFVNQVRIQEVCKKLSDPQLTITEIAYSMGYTDYSYFLKVFKKHTNCTPAKWRRNLKNYPESS